MINNKNKPLVSIITVVYNAEKYLEKTMLSVINQTYENVEYIVIDGGSTDGTLDIIKKYEDKIDYWVSEKDGGIYDAMNKGIDVVSGDWINFMNAGDVFADKIILSNVFEKNHHIEDIDVIYGDLIIDYGEFKRLEMARKLEDMWKGMVFSHQSSFINSKYHKNNKYKLDYKIGGDFEFFYNALKNNINFKYINHYISIMDVEGLSDGNRFQSIWEMQHIINDYNFSFRYNIYYIYMYFDQFMRKAIKTCLPENIINLIKINKS